jgi:hypothetical protein
MDQQGMGGKVVGDRVVFTDSKGDEVKSFSLESLRYNSKMRPPVTNELQVSDDLMAGIAAGIPKDKDGKPDLSLANVTGAMSDTAQTHKKALWPIIARRNMLMMGPPKDWWEKFVPKGGFMILGLACLAGAVLAVHSQLDQH